MKMTHMPTIHAYQRYRDIEVYAYMVTSIHPEIPPSSKLDDWVNNSINTRYNQSHMPYGDKKDNCRIILKKDHMSTNIHTRQEVHANLKTHVHNTSPQTPNTKCAQIHVEKQQPKIT